MVGTIGSMVMEVADAMVGRVWPQPHVEFNVGIGSKNSNVGHSFVFHKTEKVQSSSQNGLPTIFCGAAPASSLA
jgi:hypothetical protein